MCHLRGSEIPWRSRLNLSEVTFNGILHWAYTYTALLRAALACLLACLQLCAKSTLVQWASSATFYLPVLRTDHLGEISSLMDALPMWLQGSVLSTLKPKSAFSWRDAGGVLIVRVVCTSWCLMVNQAIALRVWVPPMVLLFCAYSSICISPLARVDYSFSICACEPTLRGAAPSLRVTEHRWPCCRSVFWLGRRRWALREFCGRGSPSLSSP